MKTKHHSRWPPEGEEYIYHSVQSYQPVVATAGDTLSGDNLVVIKSHQKLRNQRYDGRFDISLTYCMT